MVAMVMLSIAALGALSYQYYAAQQARAALAQVTAARTAQLLLEDWKSTGGSEDYDVTALGLGFSSNLTKLSPHGAEIAIPLQDGLYGAKVGDVPMVVLLDWEDVEYDSIAEVTLRQLSVDICFGMGWEAGTTVGDIKSRSVVPEVTLSTYVRLDGAGG